MQAAVLVAAVLILGVGLPLGALVWSRARYLRRPPMLGWSDQIHLEARRRRLSSADTERLDAAVNRGQLAPEDLRPLAVQLATAKISWLEGMLRPQTPRGRRQLLVAALIATGAVVVTVLEGLHRKHVIRLNIFLITEATVAVVVIWLSYRRQLGLARQAVAVNASPAAAEALPRRTRTAAPATDSCFRDDGSYSGAGPVALFPMGGTRSGRAGSSGRRRHLTKLGVAHAGAGRPPRPLSRARPLANDKSRFQQFENPTESRVMDQEQAAQPRPRLGLQRPVLRSPLPRPQRDGVLKDQYQAQHRASLLRHGYDGAPRRRGRDQQRPLRALQPS